eukprot:1789666-Rhodomonas_salina.1
MACGAPTAGWYCKSPPPRRVLAKDRGRSGGLGTPALVVGRSAVSDQNTHARFAFKLSARPLPTSN